MEVGELLYIPQNELQHQLDWRLGDENFLFLPGIEPRIQLAATIPKKRRLTVVKPFELISGHHVVTFIQVTHN
jgi:hypothetical protein